MERKNVAGRDVDVTARPPLLDRIAPCFFDSRGDRLYACQHFPGSATEPPRALLICNAILHEYERTHRAMRQLAIQAARRGIHTMRFDYFGTGDSAGECGDVSFARCQQDVGAALDQCHQIFGAEKCSVFGIRIGATLALQAAAARNDVDTLVLYAPVISTGPVIREWRRLCDQSHKRLEAGLDGEVKATEILGFPLTTELQRELLDIVPAPPNPSLRRALILGDSEAPDMQELARLLRGRGAEVALEDASEAPIWQHDPTEARVPFKLLQRIVAWLDRSP